MRERMPRAGTRQKTLCVPRKVFAATLINDDWNAWNAHAEPLKTRARAREDQRTSHIFEIEFSAFQRSKRTNTLLLGYLSRNALFNVSVPSVPAAREPESRSESAFRAARMMNFYRRVTTFSGERVVMSF